MLRGMRWLLISRIFASCRPSRYIDLPLFSRYLTCIHMVIFLVVLAVSAACARFCSFIVAQLWHKMVVQRLILATGVVMAALSVVVVVIEIAATRLAIFGVITALLVGVLGLVTMDVARFTSKLRRSLLLGLVTFVVAVTRCLLARIVIAIVTITATA